MKNCYLNLHISKFFINIYVERHLGYYNADRLPRTKGFSLKPRFVSKSMIFKMKEVLLQSGDRCITIYVSEKLDWIKEGIKKGPIHFTRIKKISHIKKSV